MDCFKCGQEGHRAAECTNEDTRPEKRGGGACFKCNQEGHFARECPNPDSGRDRDNGGEYRSRHQDRSDRYGDRSRPRRDDNNNNGGSGAAWGSSVQNDVQMKDSGENQVAAWGASNAQNNDNGSANQGGWGA